MSPSDVTVTSGRIRALSVKKSFINLVDDIKTQGLNMLHIEKNGEAESIAFRRALAKTLKIKELGINPDMSDEETNDLVKFLAVKKAASVGREWEDCVKGQRWYVEDLKSFASLDVGDRLAYEYAQAFPDVGTSDELHNALEAAMEA